MLNKFSEVIDEMESNIYQDTFQQCGLEEDSLEKIVGKSRKERALNFLMTVMANDVYVLALKNVLLTRNLGDLFKMQKEGQEMPMEKSNTGRFICIQKIFNTVNTNTVDILLTAGQFKLA